MAKNPWSEFAQLISPPPLLLGTVATVYSDGTELVTLAGAGSVRVIGAFPSGSHVFVRNGHVEGEAPAMTIIEVFV